MDRRKFIRLTSRAFAGSVLASGVYGAVEARSIGVTRVSLTLPNLPRSFHGKTIAFLSDIHHSIVVPRSYLEHVVRVTNALAPDIVVLGGDYVTAGSNYQCLHGEKYIEPCFGILKKLTAKIGRFAVTGNHDARAGINRINGGMADAGFRSIDNDGLWLSQGIGGRLRICGAKDLITQKPDVGRALGDATEKDAVILVSHNPDLAEETIQDARVGILLSGHTHGGQIVLPFIGAPVLYFCAGYLRKYRYGLVQGPKCRVFVTSGVGTLPLAIRLNCPPEIVLITLTSPSA